MVGQPIGAFYGYKMLGIFKTKEELDSYPHLADTQVGDVMFEDVNGDHKIDADDRTIIGNNMPDFTWGMTHSFTFKNFDASISLQGLSEMKYYTWVDASTHRAKVTRIS